MSVLKRYMQELVPKINAELERYLRQVPVSKQEMVTRMYEDIVEFVLRGGKRLRPLALLLSYMGCGGDDINEALKASISVEILHNASLIHDDIIDEDTLRRGKPTYHVKYAQYFRGIASKPEHMGVCFGILAGDVMIGLGALAILRTGFREDLKERALREYNIALQKIVEGEVLDITYPFVEGVTVENYLEMVDLKTGALFEASIAIGAILADAPKDTLDALRDYAVNAARAFQMHDDLLGIFGEEKVIGKPVGNDIREGRKNIVVVKALEMLEGKDKEEFKSYLGKPITREDIERIRYLLRKYGVDEEVRKLEREFADKALKSLFKADISSEVRDAFAELVKLFIERKY